MRDPHPPAATRQYSLVARLTGRFLRTPALVRLPIPAYRHHFGWLFGSRLIMLDHQGRRSGQWRHVVLERISDPAAQTITIASGFGTRAQWFRNVRANPDVRVNTHRQQQTPATAELLDAAESRQVLDLYADDNPRALAALQDAIRVAQDGTEPDIRLVRLHPAGS